MKPMWFPMSALLDGELDCWASPAMVRLPLAAGQPVTLRYVGDQMWPAFRHGQAVRVVPLPDRPLRGTTVVALSEGNLELWRVTRVNERSLCLVGDANPAAPLELDRAAILGLVPAARNRAPGILRRLRRARLDLAEARAGLPHAGADSVRRKYDSQADAYAAQDEVDVSEGWRQAIRRHLPEGGRILVVGSGTGQECRALAALGYRSVGLDFSERMVAQAQRLLSGSGFEERVSFRVADVRELDLSEGEYDGVLFTPDVYSFLPGREGRIEVLRRLGAALAARGRILLDARVVRGAWALLVLALERALSDSAEPGDSHTRFMSPDGTIQRSFVHCFSERSLHREISRSGLRVAAVERGFHVLATRGPAA